MAIRIVRLGTARATGEGVRFGTVRHLPRGVPKTRYAADNWFDVWLPNLAPSAALVALARQADDAATWKRFAKRYESEMKTPDARHLLEALAALSQHTNFSIGCYCENESRCHRSVLRQLLARCGARLVDERIMARPVASSC